MRRLLLLALGALVFAVPAASAATIDVNTKEDDFTADGFCSLREAITSANLDVAPFSGIGECPNGIDGDTITLPALSFSLDRAGSLDDVNNTGDLDVLGPTTIAGAGSAATSINATGIDRVLDIGI